jgi:PAS domain-containing protein
MMTNWHDRLLRLKQELAEVRAVRQSRANEEEAELARERDDLSRLADGLGIAGLLADVNATLLDGRGRVETVVGWEDETVEGMIDLSSPSPDLEEDEDDSDVITSVVAWEEGGQLEIIVDLGLTDEGTYLQVNGIEIRPERDALEQALLEAFRDELEL